SPHGQAYHSPRLTGTTPPGLIASKLHAQRRQASRRCHARPQLQGNQRFEETLDKRLWTVSELGPAMIPIGSCEGFLTRYLDNEPHAMDLDPIWRDAIIAH